MVYKYVYGRQSDGYVEKAENDNLKDAAAFFRNAPTSSNIEDKAFYFAKKYINEKNSYIVIGNNSIMQSSEGRPDKFCQAYIFSNETIKELLSNKAEKLFSFNAHAAFNDNVTEAFIAYDKWENKKHLNECDFWGKPVDVHLGTGQRALFKVVLEGIKTNNKALHIIPESQDRIGVALGIARYLFTFPSAILDRISLISYRNYKQAQESLGSFYITIDDPDVGKQMQEKGDYVFYLKDGKIYEGNEEKKTADEFGIYDTLEQGTNDDFYKFVDTIYKKVFEKDLKKFVDIEWLAVAHIIFSSEDINDSERTLLNGIKEEDFFEFVSLVSDDSQTNIQTNIKRAQKYTLPDHPVVFVALPRKISVGQHNIVPELEGLKDDRKSIFPSASEFYFFIDGKRVNEITSTKYILTISDNDKRTKLTVKAESALRSDKFVEQDIEIVIPEVKELTMLKDTIEIKKGEQHKEAFRLNAVLLGNVNAEILYKCDNEQHIHISQLNPLGISEEKLQSLEKMQVEFNYEIWVDYQVSGTSLIEFSYGEKTCKLSVLVVEPKVENINLLVENKLQMEVQYKIGQTLSVVAAATFDYSYENFQYEFNWRVPSALTNIQKNEHNEIIDISIPENINKSSVTLGVEVQGKVQELKINIIKPKLEHLNIYMVHMVGSKTSDLVDKSQVSIQPNSALFFLAKIKEFPEQGSIQKFYLRLGFNDNHMEKLNPCTQDIPKVLDYLRSTYQCVFMVNFAMLKSIAAEMIKVNSAKLHYDICWALDENIGKKGYFDLQLPSISFTDEKSEVEQDDTFMSVAIHDANFEVMYELSYSNKERSSERPSSTLMVNRGCLVSVASDSTKDFYIRAWYNDFPNINCAHYVKVKTKSVKTEDELRRGSDGNRIIFKTLAIIGATLVAVFFFVMGTLLDDYLFNKVNDFAIIDEKNDFISGEQIRFSTNSDTKVVWSVALTDGDIPESGTYIDNNGVLFVSPNESSFVLIVNAAVTNDEKMRDFVVLANKAYIIPTPAPSTEKPEMEAFSSDSQPQATITPPTEQTHTETPPEQVQINEPLVPVEPKPFVTLTSSETGDGFDIGLKNTSGQVIWGGYKMIIYDNFSVEVMFIPKENSIPTGDDVLLDTGTYELHDDSQISFNFESAGEIIGLVEDGKLRVKYNVSKEIMFVEEMQNVKIEPSEGGKQILIGDYVMPRLILSNASVPVTIEEVNELVGMKLYLYTDNKCDLKYWKKGDSEETLILQGTFTNEDDGDYSVTLGDIAPIAIDTNGDIFTFTLEQLDKQMSIIIPSEGVRLATDN